MSGHYKLEVWGAQGGAATYNSNYNRGGYGGFSTGVVDLSSGSLLHIYVGSAGQGGVGSAATLNSSDSTSGYNGGGYIGFYPNNSLHGGGGGATHIAKVSGLLSSLSGSISNLLIVAGGGGGASVHTGYTSYSGIGGSGGGYIGGSGSTNSTTCYNYGNGGTQTSVGNYTLCSINGNPDGLGGDVVPSPGGFGKGANYISYIINQAYTYAGGGSGFYGGWSGYHGPGGGGSGYIGNGLLLTYGETTKSMYCYGCASTNTLSIRTVSTYNVSHLPISNYAKIGNGYARITLISKN